ncbi:hypothetical protein B0T19DRAFT_401585 [Cercophora scortea]|uniref:Uncharacterized protein n=1 Tax=Cercophora scortea TaxID=314031 RepID=A0AAE0IDM3_9PEZI|nr:hypothetical protein B0T19DRAFT_401585 [Cercophora scortea]
MSTDQSARFRELLPALHQLINLHFRGGPPPTPQDPPTLSFHENQAVVDLIRSISLEQPLPDDVTATVPEIVVDDAIAALTFVPWTPQEAAEIRSRAEQAMRDLVTLAQDDPSVIDKVVWLVGQVRSRVREERKVEKEVWKMKEAFLIRRVEAMEISSSSSTAAAVAAESRPSRDGEDIVIWEDPVDQDEEQRENGGVQRRENAEPGFFFEDPDGDSDKENRDPRIWGF